MKDAADIQEQSGAVQPIESPAENGNTQKRGEFFLTATQSQLIWRAFKKHRLAHGSLIILLLVYVVAVFAGFLSPYNPMERFTEHLYAPPQRIHFWDGERFSLRPFVYAREKQLDMETLKRSYTEVKDEKYYVKLFHRGEPYKMWGLFEMRLHLFGVDSPGTIFLFGADELGRDMLSRIIFSSRISLSIGLIGVALAFILGCSLGAASGYFGGVIDNAIQRTIEFLRSIPTIPLWMGLSAALPADWSLIKRYFGITLILSLVAWTGLARVVRGKFLELRQAEFVTAARLAGTGDFKIILTHMFPGFISYLIVNSTLQIPRMILAETSLSFLGLGLRPPVISWGVLLQKAQNIRTVAVHPWLMLPVLAVILTVLLFNFVGDGLRDAADPYKSM